MTISKKTIAKYDKLIDGKCWTKGEIRGFLKLLRSRFYIDDANSRTEILRLMNKFSTLNKHYEITKEHSDQGINWLRTKVLLKRGGVASNSGFDDCDAKTIKNFKKFEFVGIHVMYNSFGEARDMAPIFRIIPKKQKHAHDYVDYAPIYWGPTVTDDNLNFL